MFVRKLGRTIKDTIKGRGGSRAVFLSTLVKGRNPIKTTGKKNRCGRFMAHIN